MVPATRQGSSVLRNSTRSRMRVVAAANRRVLHGITAGVLSVGVLDAGSALAAIEETVAASGAPDVIGLLQEYPVAASAAALVTFGGLAIAASSGKPKSQPTGAVEAFEALKAEGRTVLVDLRPKSTKKEEGLIDLKEANKKSLNLAYAEPDDDGDLVVDAEFASKLQQLAGVDEDSIIILIDSDGSLAPRAAADAAKEGFFTEKVYWVRGGVEGPKGWKANDLPTRPYRVFELPLPSLELPAVDLSALAAELQAQVPEVDLSGTVDKVSGAVNSLTDKYKENPTLANAVVAIAGIAAISALAITELEAIIQVVGALGLARFLATNLLFAKDREATFVALRAFLKDRGVDASSASGGATSSGVGDELRQLAEIVLGARNANSAAKQITEQMVPKLEGVDSAALAAALSAAGVELRMPESELEQAPAGIASMLEPALGPAPAPKFPIMPALAPAEPKAQALLQVTAGVAEAAMKPPNAAVAAVAESSTTPPNVLEARAWIEAWKSGRAALSAAATPTGLASEAVLEGDLEAPLDVAAALEGPLVPAVLGVEAPAVEVGFGIEATLSEAVPLNVLEARAWIGAWKNSQDAAVAAAADEPPPMAVVVNETTPAPVVTAAAEAGVESEVEAGVSAMPSRAEAAEEVASGVAPDVLQVREWIAVRKNSRAAALAAAAAAAAPAAAPVAQESMHPAGASVATPSHSTPEASAEGHQAVAGNVLEAREWIAAWRRAQAAQQPLVVVVQVDNDAPYDSGSMIVGGDGVSDSDPLEPLGPLLPPAEGAALQEASVVEVANVPA